MAIQRPGHEALLGHLPALRRLAVALVGAAEADDLVQDAAHSALRRPHWWASGSLAALARILRARAVDRLRREGVRRGTSLEVEEAHGRELAERCVGDAAAVAERIERHAALLDALRRLPEPMREVLVLRHFDDLTPAAIAVRLGVPASTVRTWLWRGHAELRASLEREHGPGASGWIGFLMPALAPRDVGGALTTVAASGVASVTIFAMWKLFALAAVVVATSFLVLRQPPATGLSPARLEAEQPAAADIEVVQVEPAESRRAERGAASELPSTTPNAAATHDVPDSGTDSARDPTPPELRGRVVLLDGTPGGAGVEIRVRTPGSSNVLDSAQTHADGTFARDVPLDHAYEVVALPFGKDGEPVWQPIVATEQELVLRIDALAVTLESSLTAPEVVSLGVDSFGERIQESKSLIKMGMPRSELIVASGPGYYFAQASHDSKLYGLLAEGVPSGRYTVELATQPGTLGSIVINLIAPPDVDLALVRAFVKPQDQDRAVPRYSGFARPPMRTFGRARLVAHGVLPARYAIEPYYSGPPNIHAPVRPREPRIQIEVAAGRVTELDVELEYCAGITVLVHDGTGVVDETRSFIVERFDSELGEWRAIRFSRSLEGGDWSRGIQVARLGAVCSSDPIPSGPLRVRVREGDAVLFEDEVTLPSEGYVELEHRLDR